MKMSCSRGTGKTSSVSSSAYLIQGACLVRTESSVVLAWEMRVQPTMKWVGFAGIGAHVLIPQRRIAAKGCGSGAFGVEVIGPVGLVHLPPCSIWSAFSFNGLGDCVENLCILVLGPFRVQPDWFSVAA